MKIFSKSICFFLLLVVSFNLSAQNGDEEKEMFNKGKDRNQKAIDEAVNGWWTASMKTHQKRIEWWEEAKFGMFVHWGIYSLPAGEWKGNKVSGYAEHLMRKEKISRKDYLSLASQFNPVDFNAEEWIKTAKNAGMKYFIITSKHHDGFAMYDSKISDFNIIQQTPFKRDPMKELADACHKNGMKFGFYYSHAFDWEYPDAPGNDWEYRNPGGDLGLYGGVNWYDLHPELLPKAVKYVNDKAIPQIKELIQKYHPDILWFDTPSKLPLSENIRILKAIRETDQNVVVNGRLAGTADLMFGDYRNTSDRPAEFYPVKEAWEAIPTTNESYGYHKFDDSHKPVSFFIKLMAKAASKGGNLLMNIGPMGNGKFDVKDLNILNGIGKWMSVNGESIYGSKSSDLPLQSWGVITSKDSREFLHVFDYPADRQLVLGGLKTKPVKAYLLMDKTKKALKIKKINETDLSILLPVNCPDTINTVIVLEVKKPVETAGSRLLSARIPNRLLAFDAVQHGKDLKFGDGKATRYDVENWKNTSQSLSWPFRLNEAGTFKLILKYSISPESEGRFILEDKDFKLEGSTSPSQKNFEVVNKESGIVKLSAGDHELKMIPLEIKKGELMKLMEIQLIPQI
ncbi:Alpha-L-fucosidase [Pseudarcicella hirudinis]|uniref:alpha-L-fucosidase n=1 Tax=Pseudarcicella hirudinis TaxID=1079859 RepID=A0A1I5RHV2_9BACT|nr:alpha-L-fucosidase [Pseudarcicella hirudinis]SFP58118.1 Alpha-L-fucosidase [Pseudarcicella hirudinis]